MNKVIFTSQTGSHQKVSLGGSPVSSVDMVRAVWGLVTQTDGTSWTQGGHYRCGRDLDKRLSRQIPLQQYLWQPMRVQYCSGRTGKAPQGPITAVVTQSLAFTGEVRPGFRCRLRFRRFLFSFYKCVPTILLIPNISI